MPDLRNRAQLEQQFAYGIALALNRHRMKLLTYGVERLGQRPEGEWKVDEEEIAAALILLLRQPWWDAQSGLSSSFGLIRRATEINDDFLRWADGYVRKTAADITATNKAKALAAAATLATLAPKLDTPYRPTVDEVNKQRAAANLGTIVDTRRAAGIAVTEVTRGISAGEEAAAGAVLAIVGTKLRPYAMSERDGAVCPICRAKDGREITDGNFSPFHPSCRCWVDWRII